MPVVKGRRPVRNEAREGLQIGAVIYALLKLKPRAASLSRFGVFACGWPFMGPIQSFRSSAMINRIFGGEVLARSCSAARPCFASNRRSVSNDARVRNDLAAFITLAAFNVREKWPAVKTKQALIRNAAGKNLDRRKFEFR